MPTPQRYAKVAAWNWPYIGPAFQGIDMDRSALEMSVAALQAGGGGTGGEPPVTDLTTVYNTAKA